MTATASRPDVPATPATPVALGTEAVALVRTWLAHSAAITPDTSARRLAGVLKDPHGLDFTVGFVDGVMRPQDLAVAARNLRRVAQRVPRFLPAPLRLAIRLGGWLGPLLPWAVVPVARRVLRQMVGHLIVDATPDRLGPAIAQLRRSGNRLNINLLGEAVLGEQEAARRLAGTRALLARDDVDYVSIKVSAIASQLSMWSFDEAVARVVERLTPLYELAAASPTPKFINLDMEEYRDLDLTIAVFEHLLEQPPLRHLEAGIVLQAYLPDALGALQGLTSWAQARRAAGGAAIKVRLVKGANLAMERVDATLHGWPLAPFARKVETDTNYKRVLDWALTPLNTRAVKIGVAGHNLFDVAYAHLLARQRGVADRCDVEMLLGMATSQAEAVRQDVGRLLLYTPVVAPAEFDVAIGYLIRRLEENASPENFMSAVFELADSPALFEREAKRFLASLAALDGQVPAPHRCQDRGSVPPPVTVTGFHNEPDTDPALPANRAWARRILGRAQASLLGLDIRHQARIEHAEALDRVIDSVAHNALAWGRQTGAERAVLLHRAGQALAAHRAELIEVMAAEAGKTLAEADPEVSEAIDFAHYYAERAKELDQVPGARFVPSRLTVVVPPWNFPVAIPAGGVLAALAAGSGVVLKPARLAQRCGAVLAQVLWQAGVPRELLALVDLADRSLGERLIAHPAVDRVILTGAYETARLFRSFREDLPLLAETSGKNAIIVTPSADLDLAAADVVRSAFGHAGQKCSAASLVILVGSVARSTRFRKQLVDAASSMRIGYPADPVSQMGPLIEPVHGKLLRALTTLDPGETWWLAPRPLDDSGRLWSPGIRAGVLAGSVCHRTEFFGPVLGVMQAPTLDEAIVLQNAVDYGLTAGLHSLDSDELARWLDRVEAGNLYVNRGITGAIVQRQPFGGWKRSAVGTGGKAGGPNYLFGLGHWIGTRDRSAAVPATSELDPRVVAVIEAAQSALDGDQLDGLLRAAGSDALAWQQEFGAVTDVSGLGFERNLFRYRPLPVTLRLAEGGTLAALLRVIVAATLAGSRGEVSSAVALPAVLCSVLAERHVRIESDADWLQRAAAGDITTGRVRLVCGDTPPDASSGRSAAATALAHALQGSPDIAVFAQPVTRAGRVELLPFLREQAIAITAHRFGNPSTLCDGVI